MAERALSPDERVSVARAVQLIRKANKEKADLLNDLQQQGGIVADPELPRDTYGETEKPLEDPLSSKITLNPRAVRLKRDGDPLEPEDPAIITLAGTLLHEADHAQGHDEMACFGAEVEFYQGINRDFDKYFPDADEGEARRLERRKKKEEKEAQDAYERVARKGGEGYGSDHKKWYTTVPRVPYTGRGALPGCETQVAIMPVVPGEPSTEVGQHMRSIALRIYDHFDATGAFPPSGNAQMVAALRGRDPNAFRRDELNDAGEVIDPWGQPYVYRAPGTWYVEDFDLYSLGPCRRDEGGGGDNILCELNRR